MLLALQLMSQAILVSAGLMVEELLHAGGTLILPEPKRRCLRADMPICRPGGCSGKCNFKS